MLSSCEKDTLQSDPLVTNESLEFRDMHIPDVLCKDLCEEDYTLFDFSDLDHNEVITEYQGATISAVAVESFNPLVLGDPLNVRVFDTDRTLAEAELCPTFDDPDLLFPDGPFGNVLVIQDENSPNCANDRRDGGIVVTDFSALGTITINCLTVFDTEEFGQINGEAVSGAIILTDADDNQIGDLIPIPAVEDGGAAVIEIGVSGIAQMTTVFLGSGAISSICTRVDIPACPEDGIILDFEDLVENVPVASSGGVNITAGPTPAIAFNTVAPTMCGTFDDYDMLLPAPIASLPPAFTFGNVLVNQHKSKTSCANADPRGGTIAFDFPFVSTINSMAFIDTEEEGYVTFYGEGDVFISSLPIPTTADGGFDFLIAGVEGVAKMVVDFGGSGGIDYICYSPTETPVQPSSFAGCVYDNKWWKENYDQACFDVNAEVLCGLSTLDILSAKAKGRDYYFLAQQYATTQLNATCMGAPLGIVEDAFLSAGDMLDDCNGVGPDAVELILRLSHFNMGFTGPGICL